MTEAAPPADLVLHADDLVGGYVEEVDILRGCTLTAADGEIVVVIGPNGAGKSTLARLLNGLVTATTGTVRVDGLDVARDGRAVRRRVAFSFTDPRAQLVMPTAGEDVALSLRRSHRDPGARRQAVREVLHQGA